MPGITGHSSWLSSVLPKKNPTAHSKGLSSDTARASATTLLDSSTQEPTGRTQKVRPSISTLLSRLLEPLLVGQVLAGLDAGGQLVDGP